MPGLSFQSSKWIDRLWAEHLEVSKPGRDLVAEGVRKQGSCFAGFGVDLLATLYLPRTPAPTGTGPEWALVLHEEAIVLAEWQRLRLMCQRNGFASGIAAEVVLEQLLPHVPDRPEASTESSGEGGETQDPDCGEADYGTERERGSMQLRAALRRAASRAQAAVTSAEVSLEGVMTPLGISGAGSSTTISSGAADLKAVRQAYEQLRGSKRLARIAEIAGRMERIAAAKARSTVRPGVGELHGIGLGSDLSRLLPSEVVALRHPVLRTAFVARLLEHRALVYEMEGREPLGRGPVLVLLDESASMNEGGRDIWAKGVALALLTTATRQSRDWRFVAFNGGIRREVEIANGQATAADIADALDHDSSGGTDFSCAVDHAINVLRSSETMRRADVVVISDGEDELTPETTHAAKALTESEGVSWFVVGVGPDAARCVESLGEIGTRMVQVVEVDGQVDIADIVNLEGGFADPTLPGWEAWDV